MVQISATNGIVSGIDYETLINNLIKAESAQSDAITAQNTTIKNKQTALTALIANLTALKGGTDILGQSTLFDTTSASSSNSSVVSVKTTGTPAAGTYQYTVFSKAQAQQVASSSYDSSSSTVGAGKLTFRFGKTVNSSMSLENTNGGTGVSLGKIKITDRNGTANIIDLSGARTFDDVTEAINNNGLVDVTASVVGNHIVLTDNTGETNSNLKVQEVGTGKTAATLGLAGINTDSNTVAGFDIVYLSDNIKLGALNDGLGIEVNGSADDITYKLSNGDTGSIKLAGSTTLADVIEKFGSASQYLTASLNASTGKISVIDSSGGKGTFTLTAANHSNALLDLGLTGTAVQGVINGTHVVSKDINARLSSLSGTIGVRMNDALADISYTLRDGTTGSIKLAGSKTLGDLIGRINSASTKLTATLNTTTGKLNITDSSSGSGTFTLSAINGSSALSDMGLTDSAVGGVISGTNTLATTETALLSTLNGGAGVKTIDSSADINFKLSNGDTGQIKLVGAKTIADVIDKINASSNYLSASFNATTGKISISETSGGTGSFTFTATNDSNALTDLGLNVAADGGVITSNRSLANSINATLSTLNEQVGIRVNDSLPDFKFTLSNGETGEVKLTGVKTLGDIIKKINAVNSNLRASINSDGDGLVLTDLTGGSATNFSVASENDSKALADLGLTGNSVNGVITGKRILSGAKTVLLSSLNGGNGLGTQGSIYLTNRAGHTAVVDLSGAETLDDVISAINSSGLQITAEVNDAGTGLKITDNTGQTISNLKVTDYAGGTNTAELLFGSNIDVAANTATGGDMHLRVLGVNTKLSELNGGAGVVKGTFKITNSLGSTATITIDDSMKTVGDVIKAINLSTASVLAEINATGDGIVIHDPNAGVGKLTVVEGDSTTAASLNLLNASTTDNGQQSIDGAMTRIIDIKDTDTLQNLSTKINNLKAGVTAAVVSDGGEGYRLQITSNKTGAQSSFILDTSQSDASFDWTTKAQDAVMSVGSSSSTKKASFVTSSTNDFTNALKGATLTVQSVSSSPVTITVDSDTSTIASQIQSFVSTYNSYRKTINTYTAVDATGKGSALTGDFSANQVDSELAKLVSGYYPCGNTICGLGQLGIKFDTTLNDGTITLDEDTLNSVLATNFDDVKAMFTTADTGLAAKFSNTITNLAVDANTDDPKSLLGLRNDALKKSVDKNQETIDSWTKRLDGERTRLLTQFAQLEVTLAKIQNNYNALSSIAWMTDTSSSSSNSLFSGTS